MGWNISWIAAKAPPEALAVLLGFTLGGSVDVDPDIAPHLIWIDESGFSVLHLNDPGFPDDQRLRLETASEDFDVVAVQLSGSAMWSDIAYWRDGSVTWSISHRGDGDSLHLSVRGSPPDPFLALRAEAVARQEDEEARRASWYERPKTERIKPADPSANAANRRDADLQEPSIGPRLAYIGSLIGGEVAPVEGQAEPMWVDHLFDVPIDLGAALTGYRHDVARPEGDTAQIWALVPIAATELQKEE